MRMQPSCFARRNASVKNAHRLILEEKYVMFGGRDQRV